MEDTIVELRNTISALQSDLSTTEDEVSASIASLAKKQSECDELVAARNSAEKELTDALANVVLKEKEVSIVDVCSLCGCF